MQADSPNGRKVSEQVRSDSEMQLPVSEEEIKLAEVIAHSPAGPPPRSPPQRPVGWFTRLCACFGSTQRNRRPQQRKGNLLLPPQTEAQLGKATLVLDLDETLVHSSFQPGVNADFVFELEIEGHINIVSVMERPGVHEFLQKVSELYEVVIFTASMSMYADRVIDVLDTENIVSARLFRESCTYVDGVYVKNLELLGRELKRVVIIDNSPTSYMFQPGNALSIESWYGDIKDTELWELLEELQSLAFERDFPASLPAIMQERQHKADLKRVQEQQMNEDAPPVARKLPSSPPTHAGDHGSYNSPRSRESEISWADGVLSP